MHDVTANLHECHHCQGQGTCKNGANGESCAVCVKRNELKPGNYTGLLCGSCGGIGKAEPFTERLNKRMGPFLAPVVVFSLLALVFWATIFQSPFFNQILAFAGATIGSIIGFYFSGKK